jgi:predicted MFS family arabinose efflux permease
MSDMIFASLALLLIPAILEKVGIKQIGLLAGILIVIGNVLCFLATNTVYLAVAYALTGFAGGALILVINAIIGAQKQLDDVNRGFAHFNASYLAGVNVGVVFGSIFAQFFSYRMVYLFSTIMAVILLCILVFSVRSTLVNNMYAITYFRDKRKHNLLKFIFSPVVLCTLFLIMLPYVVSMSFISYFMPVFGTDNGLRESNIGQLILLNGLFAILFGTSLCEYVSKKFSLRTIIIASLLLNIGALYLFSLNTSIPMLITVVVLLSIANIFALTNIQTYYAALYQNTRVSSMKALSFYSAVENISMAIGPLVFSYILSNDIVSGMRLFVAVSLFCLILYLVVSAFCKGKGKTDTV